MTFGLTLKHRSIWCACIKCFSRLVVFSSDNMWNLGASNLVREVICLPHSPLLVSFLASRSLPSRENWFKTNSRDLPGKSTLIAKSEALSVMKTINNMRGEKKRAKQNRHVLSQSAAASFSCSTSCCTISSEKKALLQGKSLSNRFGEKFCPGFGLNVITLMPFLAPSRRSGAR